MHSSLLPGENRNVLDTGGVVGPSVRLDLHRRIGAGSIQEVVEDEAGALVAAPVAVVGPGDDIRFFVQGPVHTGDRVVDVACGAVPAEFPGRSAAHLITDFDPHAKAVPVFQPPVLAFVIVLYQSDEPMLYI